VARSQAQYLSDIDEAMVDALDVSVQQVSRDENNEYQGISTERAQRILYALGVRFRLEVVEPIPEGDNDQEKVPS
jgi:hypothetical protein